MSDIKSNLNLANKITIARIILVPIFVLLLLSYRDAAQGEQEILRFSAILVFIAATLSDAVDGFIARTRNQKTPLGTFLDPIADKLLLVSAIVVLSFKSPPLGFYLPSWFSILAISRDLFICSGVLLIHILNGHVKVVPSILGKLATVSQMVCVLWILLKWPHPEIWVYGAASLTLASGIGYLIFGSRQLSSPKIQ